MLELPEAAVIAGQLNAAVSGKTIRRVVAAGSPHKFAWYTGDPAGYPGRLVGKTTGPSTSLGGMVQIRVADVDLVFSDGVNLRFHPTLAEAAPGCEKLPLKAFLATEQRIPGLGNGVLQDILFRAGLHPRRKVAGLDEGARGALFAALTTTLADMFKGGGRDTEHDLFGNAGGYRTRMSKNTAGQPCPACGSLIQKQAFLGGSIYFCPGCQEQA